MNTCLDPLSRRDISWTTTLVLILAIAIFPCGKLFALPTGEQLVSGQASVNRPAASSLTVQQGSSQAIVNWQGFSIGAGESVAFSQPSAASVILNRVVGANPSEIFGRMSANGQVFLVNPSGVLFGRSASIDVGGLVASTLNISNEDFLAGRYRFVANGAPSSVVNQGTLLASNRGTIALLGGQVSNEGTITAEMGTVAMAAGNKISLDFAGDGLTRINVDEAAVGALVQNRGMIVADGGQAILTAHAAQALTETVVNQQGVIQARSLVERNGRIVLDGGDAGVTLMSGVLNASGADPGQTGGEIQVLGHHVGITGGALLDASGDAGGGTVLVGGDYQGKNPAVRNAQASWFGPEATIRADALTQGVGGKVIVWSDEATRAYGTIGAKGGTQGGDGGFVETSGKFLDVAGLRVNASAPYGKAGEWLLDPNDIFIGNPSDVAPTNITGDPNFTTTDDTAILLPLVLQNALDNNTNVTVTTGTAGANTQQGNITVGIDTVIEKTAGGDTTLRLNAHNYIWIREGARISSTSGRLNLDLNSDSDANGTGAIIIGNIGAPARVEMRTNGGDVRMFGGGDPVNGRARGDSDGPVFNAVQLFGATIDTTPLAGGAGGNVLIRGQGGFFDSSAGQTAGMGVALAFDTIINSGTGNITIDGIAGSGVSDATGDGAGILLDQARLSTDSGMITLTGRGSTPSDVQGPGGDGVRLHPVSAAATNLITTTSGAIMINGIGGDGGSGNLGGMGGAGVDVAGSFLRTGTGDITLIGQGGSGGTGLDSDATAGAGGAGGAGIQIASAPAAAIQTDAGAITITGTGGTGGRGGNGLGSGLGGAGGSGGAGVASAGAMLTANANGSFLISGVGGDGGVGGNCATNFCGGGGNGGAGILQNWLIQSNGGFITFAGSGGAGGKGGDSGGVFGAGIGGFGGDGIGFSGGASLINTTGNVDLSGIAGVGGPASLSGAVVAPGTEGFNGTGVELGAGFGANPTIGTQSGNIHVFGLATNPYTNRFATGLDLTDATLATTAGGSVDLRGRADSADTFGFINAGVDIASSTISTAGGPGQIAISGETTQSFVGVRIQSGFGIAPSTIGGTATSGNIIIRAKNNNGDDALEIGAGNAIQTSGLVNLLPGGVSASGALTPADSDPIYIANPTFSGELALGPFGFVLSDSELGTIQDGTAGIVIGSQTHSGPIVANLSRTWLDDLTLQNGGAGSAGITILAPINNPGNLVTLSSGGTVTQAAPISSGSLLVHGTQPQSNFQLTNTGNSVGVFAARFEVPKDTGNPDFGDVNYVNSSALTIGPLTGRGFDFDGTNISPTTIAAANSSSGGDFFAQTLLGDLTLQHSISTLGSNIVLVSDGVFNNSGGGALAPSDGGTWRVWADTWVGENRGGLVPSSPQPNFYGCVFPGTCTSGVTISPIGNHFIYVQEPSVTVVADNFSRLFGHPNPPLTFNSVGLVNGDTSADAVVGGLSTPATQFSPVGNYPITGAFTSPVGYQMSFVPGVLTVLADTQSQRRAPENVTSDVYGRNIGTSNMCLATGPLQAQGTEKGVDTLSVEWARVREQPNLSNCVGVIERFGCQDF